LHKLTQFYGVKVQSEFDINDDTLRDCNAEVDYK